MNEVDHSPNPCTRRYPHKASATTSTTADDNPASNTTSNKTYIPLADSTKSAHQSFFLSWKAISGFAAFFVTMLVALEVMFRQSERHIGLATSSSSKHYLWTYGPTAVLTVVVALWRQLDYRTKQLMPWAEMARGPAVPDKSIMLDYVSPFLATAMYRSFRNRHFVVFLTITVFIAMKMIMIASTSLLVLQNVLVHSIPTQLLVENVFRVSDLRNQSTGQSSAALVVHGIQKYNLSFPTGTTSEYTFQSFRATADSSASASAILNGTVDYFTADIDCEVGDISNSNGTSPWTITEPEGYKTSISTTTCHVHHVRINPFIGSLYEGPQSAGYHALVQPVNCTERDSGSDGAQRLMISIGYFRANPRLGAGWNETMENVTGILCAPRYGIGRAIVIQNTTATDQQLVEIIPVDDGSQQLTGVSSWDVAEGVLSAIDYYSVDYNGTRLAFADPSHPVAVWNENVPTDAFVGLSMSANPNIPPYAYMDPQTLIAASKRTFKFLAAQIAHQNLMTPAQQVIEGSFTDHFDRMMVQQLPLRVMQGLVSATILMTIIVGLLIPRHALLGPANCIGFIIAVLHKNTPALEPLGGSGVCSIDRIRQIASFYRFQTDISEVDGRPELRVLRTLKRSTDPVFQTFKRSDWNLTREKWWRPLAFGLPATSFTLLMPLIFIMALEVLLRYSDKHQGLVDLQPGSRYQYTWLFGPTLLLVLVATLFNMLDFEIENIHPFQKLRRLAAAARSSILNNPLSKLTPHVLWDAIRSRDLALGIVAFSVMLAPFLPLIASGLYTIQNIGRHQKVQVQQVDWFQNLSLSAQPSNVTMGVLPALIAQQKLAYPQWTYNELVVPKIKLVSLEPTVGTESAENATSVVLQVSALRGAMNCSVLPESRINKTWIGIRIKDESLLPSHFDIGPYCTTWFNRRTIRPDPVSGLVLPSFPDTGGYIGQIYPLYRSYYDESDGIAEQCDDFQVCLLFGHVKGNHTLALQVLVCAPYTEQLKVNLTLTLPSYSISPTHPPVAIESSARFFSNDSFMPDSIPSLAGYSQRSFPGFFQALVYGKDGIPGDELLTNTTRLVEAVEHQYRVFAAQTYNIAYRSPFGSGPSKNESPTIDATLAGSSRFRLVQSNISTRILQGLLAVLFVCAAITYVILWRSTNGTRRILPHNPASIATMAALLVGSEMLTIEKLNIPPGTEFMSNKEMEKSGVFDGWLFSLGWWDTNARGEQRFGIDLGQASQEENKTA